MPPSCGSCSSSRPPTPADAGLRRASASGRGRLALSAPAPRNPTNRRGDPRRRPRRLALVAAPSPPRLRPRAFTAALSGLQRATGQAYIVSRHPMYGPLVFRWQLRRRAALARTRCRPWQHGGNPSAKPPCAAAQTQSAAPHTLKKMARLANKTSADCGLKCHSGPISGRGLARGLARRFACEVARPRMSCGRAHPRHPPPTLFAFRPPVPCRTLMPTPAPPCGTNCDCAYRL